MVCCSDFGYGCRQKKERVIFGDDLIWTKSVNVQERVRTGFDYLSFRWVKEIDAETVRSRDSFFFVQVIDVEM
jgi:hypothetical protein